jgi:hypothetical protein
MNAPASVLHAPVVFSPLRNFRRALVGAWIEMPDKYYRTDIICGLMTPCCNHSRRRDVVAVPGRRPWHRTEALKQDGTQKRRPLIAG